MKAKGAKATGEERERELTKPETGNHVGLVLHAVKQRKRSHPRLSLFPLLPKKEKKKSRSDVGACVCVDSKGKKDNGMEQQKATFFQHPEKRQQLFFHSIFFALFCVWGEHSRVRKRRRGHFIIFHAAKFPWSLLFLRRRRQRRLLLSSSSNFVLWAFFSPPLYG